MHWLGRLPSVVWISCALSFTSACGGARPSIASPAAATTSADDDAASGVVTPELAVLLRESWERSLREDPIFATSLGDHRYDDRWPDLGAEAHAQHVADRESELDRARGIEAHLDPADRVTFDLFSDHLETELALEVCRFDLW